jgi:peptidoglycan/xylan/chitin deacetylase (PgdA/CDA1 family)
MGTQGDFGGGQRGAPPGQRPGAVSRRVLLTAGGLTLLAGCTSAPVQHQLIGTAQTQPLPTRKPAPVPRKRHPAGSARRHLDYDKPVFYVDDGPKVIALTIDDGPSPVYTPQVLRLLDKYRVKATFSMIGIEVTEYPAVARDVAEAGHLISNHTWRHLDLQQLSPAAVIEEMDRATTAIHAATGITPQLFRAPFGAWTPAVIRHCDQNGMMPLDWSVDPRDWARPGVRSIVSNIMHHTTTGSIILEHDGGGDRSQTVAALKLVIPRLLDDGYRFTTL